MSKQRIKIQGFGVDNYSIDEAVEFIYNNHGQVVTINPEMIECAKKNIDFANIIKNAELVVADGIGIKIGFKILGHNIARVPGIELGRKLIDYYTNNGKSIALVGAKPEILEKTCSNLKNEVENINIVYSHDGYFKDDEQILNDVVNSNADLVLVALGSPKQEFFNNELKKRMPNSVFVGLGGSFDVWSGVVERAPEIYQKLGLEWLYRTVKDPKRFKRIFPTLPLFILKTLEERLLSK